jgi:hypothetical protein
MKKCYKPCTNTKCAKVIHIRRKSCPYCRHPKRKKGDEQRKPKNKKQRTRQSESPQLSPDAASPEREAGTEDTSGGKPPLDAGKGVDKGKGKGKGKENTITKESDLRQYDVRTDERSNERSNENPALLHSELVRRLINENNELKKQNIDLKKNLRVI